MDRIFDTFLQALFSRRAKVAVEVNLPYDMTSMDMYRIFKDAAEASGVELTSFEVIQKEEPI